MKKEKRKMWSYILLVIYIVAGSLGMVLIKKGGQTTRISMNGLGMEWHFSWFFFIGILFYCISFFLWIYILQIFSLTYISPVSYGLVYISTTIFSMKILETSITKEQILGAIFIIIGIVIASSKIFK